MFDVTPGPAPGLARCEHKEESDNNQTGKIRCQAENAKITELEGTVNAKNKLISYLETKCRIREESQNQKDDEFRKMFDFSVWT